jgi:hypothetical protein
VPVAPPEDNVVVAVYVCVSDDVNADVSKFLLHGNKFTGVLELDLVTSNPPNSAGDHSVVPALLGPGAGNTRAGIKIFIQKKMAVNDSHFILLLASD